MLSDDRLNAVVAKARADTIGESDFRAAIEQPFQTLLSSWELWVLVALLSHERRQKWVGFVVESKLGASAHDLGTSGALGHPEASGDDKRVPDLPEWTYYFHGIGCCLTHQDGTVLDVDFGRDGSALEIDPYFFGRFLETAPTLDWSDRRLRHASPLEDAWLFDLGRLKALRLIHGKWRISLTEEGRTFAERIEPVIDQVNRLTADGSPRSRFVASWLVTVLGDTPGAVEIIDVGYPELTELLQKAAAERFESRAGVLRHAFRSGDENTQRTALKALAALGREYAETEVRGVLDRTPASSLHLIAIRLVESWRDAACAPGVISVIERFTSKPTFFQRVFRKLPADSSETVRPRNGLLVAAARIAFIYSEPEMLPARWRAVLLRALQGDRAGCDAEAGLMLFLLDPIQGIAKLKANLRNRVPITRSESAIFLGMIGTSDAMRILVESAEGSPDDGGHEAACVLSLLDHPAAIAAAEQWTRRNDGYEESEGRDVTIGGRTIKTWKMDEVRRASMREHIRYGMERLRRDYGLLLLRWSTPHGG